MFCLYYFCKSYLSKLKVVCILLLYVCNNSIILLLPNFVFKIYRLIKKSSDQRFQIFFLSLLEKIIFTKKFKLKIKHLKNGLKILNLILNLIDKNRQFLFLILTTLAIVHFGAMLCKERFEYLNLFYTWNRRDVLDLDDYSFLNALLNRNYDDLI